MSRGILWLRLADCRWPRPYNTSLTPDLCCYRNRDRFFNYHDNLPADGSKFGTSLGQMTFGYMSVQTKPRAVAGLGLEAECPLWVVSGHSQAGKLLNCRIGARNASVSVRFRSKADVRSTPQPLRSAQSGRSIKVGYFTTKTNLSLSVAVRPSVLTPSIVSFKTFLPSCKSSVTCSANPAKG